MNFRNLPTGLGIVRLMDMKPQIISEDRSLDAATFSTRVSCCASLLSKLGVSRGDVVAVLLYNDLPFLEITLACSRIGAFTVPINWHLAPPEIAYILEDCQASVLVAHCHLLASALEGIPSRVTTVWVETPPAALEAYGLDENESFQSSGGNTLNYEEVLSACQPDLVEDSLPMGSILYTSGTTGNPKGVKRDAVTAEQGAALLQVLERFFGFAGEERVRTLIPAPLYHSAPNMYASIATMRGYGVVLMTRFDAEDMLRLIEEHRITHISLVPTMMHRLLRLPPEVKARYDLSSLRFVVTSAAHCPPEIKNRMLEWWGPVLYEFYGGTETGGVVFCTPQQGREKPGTVGQVVPEAEVRIRGPNGDELATGEVGEIYARLHCFPDFTYLNRLEQRCEIEWQGLITCGDVGYLDQDGFLYLSDRVKDMIISGGVNIYPAEIEAALLANEWVNDCAVFGIPDEEYGEKVCACILLEDGQTASAGSLVEFLRSRIAGYKIPRVIQFVESLPREESGKLFKRKLRDPYWSKEDQLPVGDNSLKG